MYSAAARRPISSRVRASRPVSRDGRARSEDICVSANCRAKIGTAPPTFLRSTPSRRSGRAPDAARVVVAVRRSGGGFGAPIRVAPAVGLWPSAAGFCVVVREDLKAAVLPLP